MRVYVPKNPGTLRHGSTSSHCRESQYGRRYSGVPGHLDLGIPVWEKGLGSPGTLRPGDPSMGEGTR